MSRRPGPMTEDAFASDLSARTGVAGEEVISPAEASAQRTPDAARACAYLTA